MSSGLSVSLPLITDNVHGAYHLNTTFIELAKQNMRMLVLTNPGERMMDPNFGAGIQSGLFELQNSSTYGDISTAIQKQVQRYLPYITINEIRFSSPQNEPDLFPNSLNINIFFTIVPVRASVALEIQVNQPI
jgi:hypothetical protein